MAVYKLTEDYKEDREVKQARAKEFIESIDLQPFFDKINEIVGATLDYKVETQPDNYYSSYSLKYKTNDIKDYCGVFGRILDYCIVESFGDGVSFDDKTGEPYLYVRPHLSYKRKNGGSNGMELFGGFYNDSEGWQFRK